MHFHDFDLVILQLGPLETNCYLIGDPTTSGCIIVDPAADAGYILDTISREGWTPEKIILTHGHYDHIGALAEIVERTGLPALIHPDDREMLTDPGKSLAALMDVQHCFTGEIIPLQDGDVISLGGKELRVLHTPGHTRGSVCLLARDFLLSGDTLFCRSVGRSDLPGGNSCQLVNSINSKLMVLDENLAVFPGHGPATSIGEEKRENPFLSGTEFYI